MQSISAALRFIHLHAAGVAVIFRAELIGGDDLGDVLFRLLVLAFAFHEVLGGVDEPRFGDGDCRRRRGERGER